MWHMVEGELSLKILAPQLLWFGIDSVLKVRNKRITHLINMNEFMKKVFIEQPRLHRVW